MSETIDTQIIDTGDSVKVKQVLDDAAMDAIKDMGYEVNYRSDNIKLLIMFLACVAAMIAQFYPVPFPQNRVVLGVCCATYFTLSCVLQFVVTFLDKDTIAITNSLKGNADASHQLRIRASFPRFQEQYTVIVEFLTDSSGDKTTGEFYVGKYFTEEGEFDHVGFDIDFKKHVKKFQDKQYRKCSYDHKTD